MNIAMRLRLAGVVIALGVVMMLFSAQPAMFVGLGGSVQAQGNDNNKAIMIDVKFEANFVQDALGTGETLPTDTTFASVAFATHESTVSYFNAGEAASSGLKSFAETGSTALLVEEFAAQTSNSNVYPKKTEGTFPQGATAAQTFEFHRASRGQDHLTFVASLSESPDWFVGARNIELRPGGVWIEELEVDLFAWDAGTDSGTDWDAEDSATDPPGNVTSLKGAGKFSDTPVGKLTISMLVPPSSDVDRRVLKADANSLDGALNVFWDAFPPRFFIPKNSLGSVEFDRYLVAWKSGTEEFQTDLNGDRVKVVMGRSSKHTILEGLTNGTDYTVRVTHANAVGPAVHHSRTSSATPAARERVLVSTFSQGVHHSEDRPFNLISNRPGHKYAYNRFTTGPSAAKLGSVTFARIMPPRTTGVPRNLVLELHLLEDLPGGDITTQPGQPGALVGVFVSPPEYVDGPAKFVAPGDGFALSASTEYWLKLVLVEGEMVMPITMIHGHDPDSQTGWEIADVCQLGVQDIWREGPITNCSYYGNFLVSLNGPVESTLPLASISGGSAVEGGTIEFTVELSSAASATATVQYDTVDGSGELPAKTSDSDYTAVSGGTITFAVGETSKTISIGTEDDSTDETHERFLVRLSNPSSNIALSELDSAAGVIINNDQTTSSDSTLAGITLTDQDGNAITLNETFDRYRFVYTADAPGSVDAITLRASFHSGVSPDYLRYFDAIGKVKEGKKTQASSAEFSRLAPGLNPLRVLVTSDDRSQESLYEILVTKTASSDAEIATLVLEDANYNDFVLSPAFSPSVTEYTATIANNPPFYVDVGLNHGGADAEVSVNGNVVIPYSLSYPADTFEMPAGQNTLVIEVTAEDGTVQTYTFAVQPAGVPATPSRPTIESVEHNSVTIAWDDPGDSSITGYQVLRQIPAIHDTGVFVVIEDDTGSSDTSYEDTTVAPETEYVYRVKARNAHGLSGRSGHVSTTTPADPTPANTAATGLPTITGTPQVGETLSVDTSGIADSDGLTNVSYSYQWIANDGNSDSGITDATGSSYTLVAADEGQTIKVRVDFTDDAGNAETLTSATTGAVSGAPLHVDPLVPPSDNQGRRVRIADAGSLPGALNVFWLNGDNLGSVKFDRYLVAWKSGGEEFQADLDGDRVKVVMGRAKDRVIIEGLTNGTEYTVRVTHANSAGPALVSSREAKATPAPRVRELVSSASQSPGMAKPELFSVRGAPGFRFGLVQFTTGPAAKTLGSVTFLPVKPLHVDGHPRNLVVELRLYEDDDGSAPALIGTFVSPPEYVDGPAKFVAPGDGFALSASTSYWLKLVLVQGEMHAYVTRHGEEDPTGQPGWTLLDDCRLASTDTWPYTRSCTTERHLSHGPFLMSLNSPLESALPRASISGGSAVEGENVEFTVELSSAPSAQATVQYDTIDGSGHLPATTSDSDYTAVSGGTITFEAGDTSKTISIATSDDATDENNERFLVRLSNPSANIALSELDSAAGVIINDDQTTSSDSTLQGLTLTDGDGNTVALNETFDPLQFVYTADAGAGVDKINLNLSFDEGVNPHYLRYFDAIGEVKEGGKPQASSAEFSRLVSGLNPLRVLVTSDDRSQDSLYEIMVTRSASSDATIATLVLEDDNFNDFVLSPAFSPSVTEYTATIANNPPFYVDVGLNHGGADAEVSVNGAVVVPYSLSYPADTFEMPAGQNTLVIEVTAEDGTVQSYTFTLAAQRAEVPATPSRPTIESVAHNSVTIVWNDPGDSSITGYQVLRRNPAIHDRGVFVVIEDDTGSSDTSYEDTTVAPETKYVYRVKARNAHGLSGMSSYRSATTPADPTPANTAATGLPTITGTPQVGETLSVDTSGVSDANGLTNVQFTYQWIRNDGNTDTEISGATGQTYTLTRDDQGNTIKVRVSFTDDDGYSENVTSAATGTVAKPPNVAASGQPTIAATAVLGETLGADTSGISDENGLTGVQYNYQWVRSDGNSDTEISGATGQTYALTDSDVGKTIRVQVSFTDDDGYSESVTSAATGPVSRPPNQTATGLPTITGTEQVGETLTTDTSGIADENGLTGVQYNYQWVRNDGNSDAEISGATGQTYTLTRDDQDNTIKVRVSFTDDDGYSESVTSAATGPVSRPPNQTATGLPTITGTEHVGETLTTDTSGIADANGLTNVQFTYQWIRNDGNTDTNIPGATGQTYTLTDHDQGNTIKVRVSFTDDDGYSENVTSAATAEVDAEAVELLWSAEMTVADYGNGSLGAYNDDTLFSNVTGSLQLQVKWLWYSEPERKLYLAFKDPISGTADWKLHIDDLALDFPSGDSNFTFGNVDVSWTEGQVVNVSIVR